MNRLNIITLPFLLFVVLHARAEDSAFTDFLEKNQKEHYDANLRFSDLAGIDLASDLADDSVLPFCDAAQILAEKQSAQNYYEVFRHVTFPIYFYKFGSKKFQDLTFDRMSDFVEQDEGQLVEPDQHHYPEDDGNDLRGTDVAAFFNAMQARGRQLTAFESRLKLSLVVSGNFVATEEGSVRPSKDFVLVSAASDSSRGTVEHELSHAVYFTDPAYRLGVIALYESLSPNEKQLAAKILDDIGGHKFAKAKETFYTEFGAYFRDPPVLYRDGADDHAFTSADRSVVQKVALAMAALEKVTAFFKACPDPATAKSARVLSLLSAGRWDLSSRPRPRCEAPSVNSAGPRSPRPAPQIETFQKRK